MLNSNIWSALKGDYTVLKLKEKYWHGICYFCREKVNTSTSNKLFPINKIWLFNVYGIIINGSKFRYCTKCVDIMLKILYHKKANNYISKYFTEDKQCGLGDLITTDIYLLLHKYANEIKKIKTFYEKNYNYIKKSDWYQMCSLDHVQFKELVDDIMENIRKLGILLYFYYIFTIYLPSIYYIFTIFIILLLYIYYIFTFNLLYFYYIFIGLLNRRVILGLGEEKYKVNLMRHHVWISTLLYNSALRHQFNYSLIGCMYGIHWETARSLIMNGLVIGHHFFSSYYQSNKYWTPERIKNSVPADYELIYGKYVFNINLLYIYYIFTIFLLYFYHKFTIYVLYREIFNKPAVVVDGTDIPVCKVSDMNIQSYMWSGKSKQHALRSVLYCTLNGIPIISVPSTSMFIYLKNSNLKYIIYIYILKTYSVYGE